MEVFILKGKELWEIYSEEAEKYDKRMVQGWKDDMDGTLIFAGLFSATVTVFITEAYKSLHPSSSPPAPRSKSVLIANILFLFSLAFTLTDALAAILVKQWARNYLDETLRRSPSIQRARVRSYLHAGIQDFRLPLLVDTIPTLLHISLFLFFAGVYQFFAPLDPTVCRLSLAILSCCVTVYLFLTLVGALSRRSPYRTPLSFFLWHGFHLVRLVVWHWRRERPRFASTPREEMEKKAMIGVREVHDAVEPADQAPPGPEDHANPQLQPAGMNLDWELDLGALHWTVCNFTTSDGFELFVARIPSFLASKDFANPLGFLHVLIGYKELDLDTRVLKLLQSCRGLRTPECERRAVTCMNAIWYFTCATLQSNQPASVVSHPRKFLLIIDALKIFLEGPAEISNRARSIISLIISKWLRDLDVLNSRDERFNVRLPRLRLTQPVTTLDNVISGIPELEQISFSERLRPADEQQLKSLMKDARIAAWALSLSLLNKYFAFPDFIFTRSANDSAGASSIARYLTQHLECSADNQIQNYYIQTVDKIVPDANFEDTFAWSPIGEQLHLIESVDDMTAVEGAIRIVERAHQSKRLNGLETTNALEALHTKLDRLRGYSNAFHIIPITPPRAPVAVPDVPTDGDPAYMPPPSSQDAPPAVPTAIPAALPAVPLALPKPHGPVDTNKTGSLGTHQGQSTYMICMS